MNIIGIGISFIEILVMFLIYNIIINRNIFKNLLVKTMLSLFTSVIYYVFVHIYITDQLIIFVGMLFINSIIISRKEKKDTIVTFIEFIVSSIIVLLFELLISFGIYIATGADNLRPITYLVILTFSMILLIFLLNSNKWLKKIDLSGLFSKFKSINIIILNLFVFFLFIKVLMANDLMETNIIIPVTILGLILIGINCYFYMFLYKTLNEKKKKEIKKSFNPLINDLMGKLKANEHEYKNHLNTIWSIAQVSDDGDIRNKLKEYISTIVENSNESSIILDIDNTILKAVLYNKSERAEKLGITYKYNIKSNLLDIPLDNSELTVVLSNLLNNAIEATSLIEKKELEVNIIEDNKFYVINVKNRSEGLKLDNLSNIFKMGYTTKGEGRGYGLYNVKKIVEKYKGKIEISLEDDIVSMSIKFAR